MKPERLAELREWLEGEYIGMGQAIGLCEPGNKTDDSVKTGLKDQMRIVKDLLSILDEHAALKTENERLEKKASDTLAIQVRAEARAKKAEAENERLEHLEGRLQKLEASLEKFSDEAHEAIECERRKIATIADLGREWKARAEKAEAALLEKVSTKYKAKVPVFRALLEKCEKAEAELEAARPLLNFATEPNPTKRYVEDLVRSAMEYAKKMKERK